VSESGGGRDHRSAPVVGGGDDLVGVDAVQVDRGCVTELALDDAQCHALAGELERVAVAELVRRKAPAYAGLGRQAMELEPDSAGPCCGTRPAWWPRREGIHRPIADGPFPPVHRRSRRERPGRRAGEYRFAQAVRNPPARRPSACASSDAQATETNALLVARANPGLVPARCGRVVCGREVGRVRRVRRPPAGRSSTARR
jgi:hypothetical protein